jgi:predicted Zn finger-like uncharacterized protein
MGCAAVYIECEHCEAGYELDLPPAALAGGRSVKFRCTSCGHSFHVVKDGTVIDARPKPGSVTAEETAPKAAPSTAVSAAMDHVLLRQDGVSYHVPDVATLQRWIVERRVLPTDELDFGGGQWVQAGDRPDLAPFFAIVTEVEVATRKLAAVAAPLDDQTEGASELGGEATPAAPDGLSSELPSVPMATEVADANAAEADQLDALDEVPDDAALAGAVDAGAPDVATPEPAADSDALEGERAPQVDQRQDTPEAGVETPSGRVALSTMVDGDLLADWDDVLPETEEADRPPWLDELDEETAIADMEPATTSSGYSGVDRRSSAEAISTSRALWPEADPPSSPFSKPPVDAEVTVSMEESAPTVVADLSEAPEAEGGLAWADDLFREAPLPGEPSIDEVFDDPASEAEPEDMEIGELELVGNAEVDSLPIQDEDDGWFAVGDGQGDSLSTRRQSPYAGWALAAIILVMVGGMFWVTQHDATTANPSPAKITVNTAGNGAVQTPQPNEQPGEGAKDPAEGATESEAGAKSSTEGAAAGEGSDAGAGDGPAGDGAPPTDAEATPAEPKKRPRASNTAEAIANRGWRALDRSKVDTAEKHFSDALKVNANHAVATYGLAYIAHQRADVARATGLYCRARTLAGSNRELVREVNAGLNKLNASCP